MRVCKESRFGKVEAFELGYGWPGKPLMTVFLYLVDGVLLDTGLAHMRHKVLDIARERPVRRVLLTHHHEDHSANAAALQELLKVPVQGHPLCAEKMAAPFRIRPYQHWIWGSAEPLAVEPLPEAVETDRLFLVPVHTPGHSKDHVVYHEPRRGWLFSGDLYLADRVRYFRADEDMAGEIASLKKALELDFTALFCCHRPRPEKGRDRIVEKLQYLEDLYGTVQKLWEEGRGVSAIMRKAGLREDRVMRLITLGNVSVKNMVRSVVKDLEKKRAERQPGQGG
jgi:glyoxylase-like metal-dependent hydrolase (beta-lactamase superfamily II)